jgi:hypothetical protein
MVIAQADRASTRSVRCVGVLTAVALSLRHRTRISRERGLAATRARDARPGGCCGRPGSFSAAHDRATSLLEETRGGPRACHIEITTLPVPAGASGGKIEEEIACRIHPRERSSLNR